MTTDFFVRNLMLNNFYLKYFLIQHVFLTVSSRKPNLLFHLGTITASYPKTSLSPPQIQKKYRKIIFPQAMSKYFQIFLKLCFKTWISILQNLFQISYKLSQTFPNFSLYWNIFKHYPQIFFNFFVRNILQKFLHIFRHCYSKFTKTFPKMFSKFPENFFKFSSKLNKILPINSQTFFRYFINIRAKIIKIWHFDGIRPVLDFVFCHLRK